MPLGLGLTQLYNEYIVCNRKRHGRSVLGGKIFSFRRTKNIPPRLRACKRIKVPILHPIFGSSLNVFPAKKPRYSSL